MENVIKAFIDKIDEKSFPCVAAKDALNKDNIKILTAGHLGCPNDDEKILDFIYDFVETFREQEKGFHSEVILFPETEPISEEQFENLLFQRLKALRTLDARFFSYDPRVSDDPISPEFSYSLKEEAFFIIGLHPNSSRPARRFSTAAIVFNPHVQFEKLREDGNYHKMRKIVRSRDEALAGSVNPMLMDFGTHSEIFQYSGRERKMEEGCPFDIQPDKK